MINSEIEEIYNNIKSPPKFIPYKTVTWHPKWNGRYPPFNKQIVFRVKLNTKDEVSFLSTLEEKRNEAKENPRDYNKTIEFCNFLFNSMKFIENEQSDILSDAFKLLKMCVKEKSLEAYTLLAKLYLFGIEGAINHTPNYERASQLYMKVLKENTQQKKEHELDPEITYNVGLCYEQMESKKKRQEAISFFKFAALNGHPGASFKLYNICENTSPKEAVKWLTISKDNATKEFPEGLYEYALLCYKGYKEGDIEKNEECTITLLKEAEDKLEHAQSAFELGKYYLITEGVTSINAGKYFYKAASRGNMIAHYKLAKWWRKQQAKSEMKKKAYFEWLVSSTRGKENLLEAIYRIGYCYEIGYGVPKDKSKAQSYYGSAASKGHIKAKDRLEKLNI